MNTMTTYSGRKFDPMQMTPGDVYIEDIAHALSLLCRGGGQLSYFYSVGQHSLNCAAEAKARGWSERQQLACLLHDASEGYISDIIRPVKIYLSNYLEIESKIMGTILTHFGLDDLTEEESCRWKQIDDEILELIAKDNRDQSVFYEAYSFAAGKLAIEDGSLKTEAKYYSTTAPAPAAAAEAAPAATEQPTQTTAPAQATQNSTSSEYDNVPKTGENSAMFWLLGAAVVCMAGGYTIRRKNVQEAE